MIPWGCNKLVPLPHPIIEEIKDVSCGYDDRMIDERCEGCWRQRIQGAHEQLEKYREHS